MHIKFLDAGQRPGCGQRAVQYLLSATDASGEIRAGVRVLRGMPLLVERLIDSSDRKNKYTSAVIAWHPSDRPSDADIAAVLSDFETLAAAGLERDRVSTLAVQHTESDGSTHIHVLIPRTELYAGKAFNPAPPGWQRTYDTLRDMWNLRRGWVRPDQAANARLIAAPPRGAAEMRLQLELGDIEGEPREAVGRWLQAQIQAGQVEPNRDGVLTALRQIGEISRTGGDYISIKFPGQQKAIRLRGALYSAALTRASFDAAVARQAGAVGVTSTPLMPTASAAEIEAAETAFRAAVQRRAEQNAREFKVTTTDPLEVFTHARHDTGRPQRVERVEQSSRLSIDRSSGSQLKRDRRNAVGAGISNDSTNRLAQLAADVADRDVEFGSQLLGFAGSRAAAVYQPGGSSRLPNPVELDELGIVEFDSFGDPWGLRAAHRERAVAAGTRQLGTGPRTANPLRPLPGSNLESVGESGARSLPDSASTNMGRGGDKTDQGMRRVLGSISENSRSDAVIKPESKMSATQTQRLDAAQIKAGVMSLKQSIIRSQQRIKLVDLDVSSLLNQRYVRYVNTDPLPQVPAQPRPQMNKPAGGEEAEDRAELLAKFIMSLIERLARIFGISLNLTYKCGRIEGTAPADTDPESAGKMKVSVAHIAENLKTEEYGERVNSVLEAIKSMSADEISAIKSVLAQMNSELQGPGAAPESEEEEEYTRPRGG